MPWITWRHACLYTLIYICIQLLSIYSACFYPATSFGKHCPAICIYPACPIFKHASKRTLLPQYICPEKVVFYGILSQLWKFLFFKNLDNNLNLNEKKSWTTHLPWEWQLHDCMLSELHLSSQLLALLFLLALLLSSGVFSLLYLPVLSTFLPAFSLWPPRFTFFGGIWNSSLQFWTLLNLLTKRNCNIWELIIWISWVFCSIFQILSQYFELCSETNRLSQQPLYLCRLSISGLRNAPMLSIWKNEQVIFLSSLSTAGTKCKVKQYNSHDTPNFDVLNQN